jgi:N-acetylglucosamine-6-phosphate deacetylase
MSGRLLGVRAALVDGALLPGDVEVVGDRVTRIGLPAARGGRIAAPGYLDLQVNGFAGVDVMSADADGLRQLARALASYGVTSWLPTLITAPERSTERALRVLRQCLDRLGPEASRPLGVHLEGPFLSPERLGTHPAADRRDPDPDALRRWLGLAPVVAVTLAAELPGALDLVRRLAAAGVLVSIGHSDATAEQAHAAFDAGARSVTHLFNAMSPLRHRAAGLPGVALSRTDVTVQLIVDGHHLADEVVRLAWAAARGRVVLVTDATEAAGLADGSYSIAGVPVEVRGGAVRNDRGTLAGSALTLDVAVRNACALGLDVAEVLTSVTATAADLLGRPDLGRLRPGARADVVVLEEDLTVAQTWLAGTPVEPDRSAGRVGAEVG